jgi:ribonuclease HI
MNNTINIFTDGSCLGNPGPGGWAFLIDGLPGHSGVFEKSGSTASGNSTNNRMELTACIEALLHLKNYSATLCINSDSRYVIDGATKWIHNWKNTGWKTASKTPVKNYDLWKILGDLLDLPQFQSIEFKWVPAHAGVPYNERVDTLAKIASNQKI